MQQSLLKRLEEKIKVMVKTDMDLKLLEVRSEQCNREVTACLNLLAETGMEKELVERTAENLVKKYFEENRITYKDTGMFTDVEVVVKSNSNNK